MSYLERAIAATIRADVAGTRRELIYCEGPGRHLLPIAEALNRMDRAEQHKWLHKPAAKLGGRTPLEVLNAGDPGWFVALCRLLPPKQKTNLLDVGSDIRPEVRGENLPEHLLTGREVAASHINWPIFVLDFEASGLGEFTYPIELGIACWPAHNAEIETWSSLIRPPWQWVRHRIWNVQSEGVHRISRYELDAGITPAEALSQANALIGTHDVFCDGGEHDLRWLLHLAHAARIQPSFRLHDWRELTDTLSPAQLAAMANWKSEHVVQHRAGDDAKRLMMALAVGLVV